MHAPRAHAHTHARAHQHAEYAVKYTSTLRYINYFFSYNECETQYANMMGMNTFLRNL